MSRLLLLVPLLVLTACGDAGHDAVGTEGAMAQVTGSVVRVSDVVGQQPEPEPGGEVWFVPTSAPGYDGSAPDEALAVAVLSIDVDGSYGGEVPVGEWRPCVRQEGRRTFCSDGTVTVPEGGAGIGVELGDGYVGFDVA